jgi:hypothetical protein
LIALPTAGAADADFPADLGRVQQRQTAASNSHASWPLEPIASIARHAARPGSRSRFYA